MIMSNEHKPALTTLLRETVVPTRMLAEPVQHLQNGGWPSGILRYPGADRYAVAIRHQELMLQMRIHSQKPVRMLSAAGGNRELRNMTGGKTRA